MMPPTELALVRQALAELAIEKYSITIGRTQVIARFEAVGRASCLECSHRPLAFVTEDGEELDDDQLACTKCGGMFAVSDLLKV